jgi:hypothetical protein
LTTQSNTALSLGTRFMVLSGRNTLSTRSDLMVDKFVPTDPPLKRTQCYYYYYCCCSIKSQKKRLWRRATGSVALLAWMGIRNAAAMIYHSTFFGIWTMRTHKWQLPRPLCSRILAGTSRDVK